MKEKKSSSFRGKVISSAKMKRSGRGYLNLPAGVKAFRLPEGVRSFQLDIVPYVVTNPKHLERNEDTGVAVPGSIWYRSPLKIHRNVGSENETVVCPRTFGKRCPICEYQTEIIKKGADKEVFKVLYPQERSLYSVVPIGHKDFDEVPHVWDMADFLFQETLIDELEEDPSNEDFFLPDNGRTISLRIKWKEVGKNSFPEIVSLSFEKRKAQYDDSIVEESPKLDDLLKVLSYEELYAKFHFSAETAEISHEDDDIEEDIPAPTTRRPAKSIKKEEEAEEEEKPVRRRKPVEEEEEEEEKPVRKRKHVEEEEEEEEEKPVRTRGKEKKEDTKECPYGHVFGKDTDAFKDCAKCKIWEDCIDEKEKR